MEDRIFLKYIPLDKSWMIRVGVLDIINGYTDITAFLESQDSLSDDLKALYRVSENWNSNNPLDVGESATLYRFLKFASWKLGKDKKFILRGTLKDRKICNNPEIINWSLKELLTLDNGTSQWASASVLLGNQEKIANPPYKLQLTYDAVKHWKERRACKKCWLPRYDKTIERQAEAFLQLMKTGKTNFVPKHSEDYCFARAFDLITPEEGEEKFPSLRNHETDRIKEMEKALRQVERDNIISSKDHRVTWAVAARQISLKKDYTIKYPSALNKSFPKCLDFLDYCKKL